MLSFWHVLAHLFVIAIILGICDFEFCFYASRSLFSVLVMIGKYI